MMSTSFADFITAWNESMPIQIRDSDIKNPTEQTFRRLLIAILKKLNVDTSGYENMDSEAGNLLRASRVRLIATVNYFFKIANPDVKKRHDLVFMDLVQPSFKKVFNTLNYLMNYSVYVNHRYKETVLDLNEKLQERDELCTKRNEMRKAIEEAKIKQEINVKEIKDLDIKIPRQKTKISEIEEKQEHYKTQITKLNEMSDKVELELIEYKNELEALKNAAMSEEEIEGIFAAKQSTLQRLDEQSQFITAVRHKLKENSQAIEEAQEITNKMEALTMAFNIDPNKVRSMTKEASDIEARIALLKVQIAKTQSETAAMKHTLSVKKTELSINNEKLDELQNSCSAKSTGLMKQLKEVENLLCKLKTQESNLAATYARLRQKQNYMVQVAANVIKHLSNRTIDDENTEN